MNCDEITRRLSAFKDGELSGLRRWTVSAHVRSCPECAGTLRELEEIDQRVLAGVRESETPEYLTTAVMRRLPAMPPAARRIGALRWAAGLMVAVFQVGGMYGAYRWGLARGQSAAPLGTGQTVVRPGNVSAGVTSTRSGAVQPAASFQPSGPSLWTRHAGPIGPVSLPTEPRPPVSQLHVSGTSRAPRPGTGALSSRDLVGAAR